MADLVACALPEYEFTLSERVITKEEESKEMSFPDKMRQIGSGFLKVLDDYKLDVETNI